MLYKQLGHFLAFNNVVKRRIRRLGYCYNLGNFSSCRIKLSPTRKFHKRLALKVCKLFFNHLQFKIIIYVDLVNNYSSHYWRRYWLLFIWQRWRRKRLLRRRPHGGHGMWLHSFSNFHFWNYNNDISLALRCPVWIIRNKATWKKFWLLYFLL